MNTFNCFLKIFTLIFLLSNSINTNAEEKKIKKIIIDNPSSNQRLLTPSIDKEKNKIQLIPPKEISEKKIRMKRENRSSKKATRRKKEKQLRKTKKRNRSSKKVTRRKKKSN